MSFLRWVTGTPPCDPNLSQPSGNYCSVHLTRSVRRRAASFKRDYRNVGILADAECKPDAYCSHSDDRQPHQQTEHPAALVAPTVGPRLQIFDVHLLGELHD